MSRLHRNLASGFTLVELLAVIVILVLLIGLAVPTFSATLRSSDRNLAENKVSVSLIGAQSVAYRSGGRNDGAAVFMYEPDGGVSIVTAVVAGRLQDETSLGASIHADVFAPVSDVEPVQLPRGWTVRGYALAGSMDQDWYDDNPSQRYDPNEGNWLFPETDFYDKTKKNDGEHRQSFMARFDSATAQVSLGSPQSALVLDPRRSSLERTGNVFGTYRADEAIDYQRFVQRVLRATNLFESDRRELLGDESSDTILARPLQFFALTDERRMASSLGLTLDERTRTFYDDSDEPEVDETVTRRINDWIEDDESSARVYTVDRYSGSVQEIER